MDEMPREVSEQSIPSDHECEDQDLRYVAEGVLTTSRGRDNLPTD
jgi:hypothetical protein